MGPSAVFRIRAASSNAPSRGRSLCGEQQRFAVVQARPAKPGRRAAAGEVAIRERLLGGAEPERSPGLPAEQRYDTEVASSDAPMARGPVAKVRCLAKSRSRTEDLIEGAEEPP